MKKLKILTLIVLLSTILMAQKEALIIGVGDYYNNDLNGIETDIYNMETLLRKWNFHVTKLTDSKSLMIINKLQSYTNLSPNDTFIFYFSGHGYHIPDKNGDESDGEDEAIVLSNSQKNILFIDDEIFGYLNKIKAKKVIIFDSCHSGTAFKDFNNKVQPKTLPEGSKYELLQTKAFRRRESNLNSGKYIVLSASQDNEVSLATPNGSLFTNALVSELKSGGGDQKLLNLKSNVDSTIKRYCNSINQKAQHPNIIVSSPELQNLSLKEFIDGGESKPKLKPKITVTGNRFCNNKELLKFQIDTHGTKGYLTIFSIEKGKPLIMAQTSTPVGGVLNFQDDFNINPPIECYKSCGNCPSEESGVYIILSPKKLTLNEIKSKGLIINNSNISTRAFRHRSSGSYEPVIVKTTFIIR
jgi:hypothetical protein